ncbi:MAG: tetratricopeptide repeat protein [Verrucomicrobiales bacterium]|nr:tetratricopeptide repeat protein [Verrucomicrobiales bacterium]
MPSLFSRIFWIAVAALALLSPTGASAQSVAVDRRADLYLRAYMINNDGEQLEKAGDLANALRNYEEAGRMFEGLAQENPDWEVEKMTMRRRKVQEAMLRVQAAMKRPSPVVANQPPPSAAPQMPVAAAPGAAPQAPQGVSTWSVAPPSGASSSGKEAMPSFSEMVREYEERMQGKVRDLENENLRMERDLGKWQQWYQWASDEIRGARTARDTLANQAQGLENRMRQMEREVQAGRANQGQLDALLQEKAALVARVKQAEQRLDAAQRTATEASTKVAALTAELDQMKQQASVSAAEREKLAAENKALKEKAMAFNESETGDQLKKLMVENERLQGELDAARKQVVDLQKSAELKDQEIAQLKTQLTGIQEELGTLRRENTAYQTQVSELTLKLKELEQVSKETPPAMVAENEMLRGIIMRQLRNQARQQQAKALVIEQLQQLENANETLIEQVRELDQNRLTLSGDEERLFTDPQVKAMLREGDAGAAAKGTLMASSTAPEPAEEKEAPAGSAAAPVEPEMPRPAPVAVTVEDLIFKGNEALAGKRYEEARADYQEALRADPRNASALIGLGVAYQLEGKLTDAEVALKKCLAYEPENSNAYFALGKVLFAGDRAQDAINAFEKSVQFNPKDAKAHHYLGIIASRQMLAERAEKEFRTALAIDPTFAEAHFNLAVLYVSWNPPRWENARQEYEAAVAKGVEPDAGMEKLLNSRVSSN